MLGGDSMQQWEYARITHRRFCPLRGLPAPTPPRTLVYFGNGTQEFVEGESFAAMGRLGLEGWELVSTTTECDPTTGTMTETYTFKRPKPSVCNRASRGAQQTSTP